MKTYHETSAKEARRELERQGFRFAERKGPLTVPNPYDRYTRDDGSEAKLYTTPSQTPGYKDTYLVAVWYCTL